MSIIRRNTCLFGLLLAACGGPDLDLASTHEDPVDIDTTREGLGTGEYAWLHSDISPYYADTYNSTGGSVVYTQVSTGHYRVTINGVHGAGGNVQVVAVGGTSKRCKVGGWGGSPIRVTVFCHDAMGSRSDAMFLMVFARSAPSGSQRWGYVWANDAAATLYTPSTTYQQHYAGNNIAIYRSGTGRYRVYVGGISQASANATVTAYGSGPEHCNVALMGQGYVDVTCWSATNAPVDTRFTLAYVSGGALLVPTGIRGGYFHANRPTATAPYVPARSVEVPASTGYVTVDKVSTGNDVAQWAFGPVTYPLGSVRGMSLVTSYASGAAYCSPTFTGQFSVRCYLRLGSVVYGWNAEYLVHTLSNESY